MANDSGATGSGRVAGRPEGGVDLSGGVAEVTLGVTGAGFEAKAAHTPGPWHCDHESKYQTHGTKVYRQWGNAGNQQLVADASAHDENSDECLANARLIAAAPDLLAACQAALAGWKRAQDEGYLDNGDPSGPGSPDVGWPEWMHSLDSLLRAAIAKATADRSSPAGTRPAEHTPGTVGTEARRDDEDGCDFCGGSGVICIERDPDGSGGGAVPCSRCRPSGPRITKDTPREGSKTAGEASPAAHHQDAPRGGRVEDPTAYHGAQSQRTLNATLDAMRRSPVPGVDVRA